ncbi:hypothetical protein BU26DRAFT_171784 [Trematosphaeria pertusa]|uniref:Uncharacterized protein n=1 Tax=Trematosphaeria pertusa TaxID=390896 RepID=A0A6A6HUL9_9PLEO|nr:uncharacterized protein BU26DRAFT_171784 [Trematosphaeria pertusa]KAF2241875.1 hypothetical protein BU26DRAFT_171784 [Trematosphaeria pertusa]
MSAFLQLPEEFKKIERATRKWAKKTEKVMRNPVRQPARRPRAVSTLPGSSSSDSDTNEVIPTRQNTRLADRLNQRGIRTTNNEPPNDRVPSTGPDQEIHHEQPPADDRDGRENPTLLGGQHSTAVRNPDDNPNGRQTRTRRTQANPTMETPPSRRDSEDLSDNSSHSLANSMNEASPPHPNSGIHSCAKCASSYTKPTVLNNQKKRRPHPTSDHSTDEYLARTVGGFVDES